MPRLSRPRKPSRERDPLPFPKRLLDHARSCLEAASPVGFIRAAALSVGGKPKWKKPLWIMLSAPEHPSRRRLLTVQDFFKYTEEEGRLFFRRLDTDRDGRVSMEDMKAAMRARKLPEAYAHEFMKKARGGKWWMRSIGWEEFKMVSDERESEVLRAFTALNVSPRGRLELSGIQDSLKLLGLPASEGNARAMLNALDSNQDGFVSYGKFRNFALLLPKHRLQESVEPSMAWFESATMLPLGPVPESTDDTGKMLLTAALAGGLASGLSTFCMHPIDTLKTRIQSSVNLSVVQLVKSVPKIGTVGLYRGVLPATAGSSIGHGLRTCAYEGTLKMLTALTGGAAELQMQGLASGVGTVLGTALRIPCEVLKQRLQVGQHENVQEAIACAIKVDGPKSLFTGTTATLSREVPFYMFGIIFYQILKKVFRGEMFGREGRMLEPWETLTVGALSGALGAIVTTPADVMKTRIMTAPVGSHVKASQILIDILRVEGIPALFKGALPRAIWIAPLGAMNFAGYELAKNALGRTEQIDSAKPEEEADMGLDYVPEDEMAYAQFEAPQGYSPKEVESDLGRLDIQAATLGGASKSTLPPIGQAEAASSLPIGDDETKDQLNASIIASKGTNAADRVDAISPGSQSAKDTTGGISGKAVNDEPKNPGMETPSPADFAGSQTSLGENNSKTSDVAGGGSPNE